MGREDPFLTCDEEVHSVVYDAERAESVCSKCGLVVDEAKLTFLLESNAVPRKSVARSRKHVAPKHSLEDPLLERNLRSVLFETRSRKVVQDKALELCNIVRKQRLLTGYPVSTLSATLIYAAHRSCRVPVTLAECTSALGIERRKVARCYDKLCQRLKLAVRRFDSTDYLPLLAKRKEIDDDTTALARKLVERVEEKRLIRGANPIGIAAAALYIAGSINDYRIAQKEFASLAMVSEKTIRVNCKRIKSILQIPT